MSLVSLAARCSAGAYAVAACAPLGARVVGIMAVLWERVQSHRWPDYSDAVFRSNPVLTWMLRSGIENWCVLAWLCSPLLILLWLWLARRGSIDAGGVARAFQRLVAVWVVSMAVFVVLAKLSVTGVY